MTAVEDGRQLVFGDHLVDRPGHLVVGIKALHRRMELETLDAVFLDQAPRFACAHFSLVRIDAGKSDHQVAVLLRRLGDLLVWNTPAPKLGFRVDREHHHSDLAFAVVRDRLIDGRTPAGAEILVSGAVVFLAVLVVRIPAGNLRVSVRVHGALRRYRVGWDWSAADRAARPPRLRSGSLNSSANVLRSHACPASA